MTKLTYYEQLTLDKINSDLDFFINNNLKSISKQYNISDASIVRLFKKLGYKNLKTMQMNFYNKRNIMEMTSIKEMKNSEKSTKDIIDDVSSYSLYSILKTKECLNKNKIDDFAAFLLKANKALAFGIGNSNIAAQFFTSQLNKIGLNCFSPTSIHDLMIQKEYLTTNDILVIFSTSLKTKEIKFILQKLQSFKFKVAIFTEQNNENKLDSDFTIYYSKHDSEVEAFPAISALMSQIYAVNIIFNSMLNKLSDTKIKKGNNDNFEWNKE